MTINVWLECLEPNSDHACILAIGNNTSTIGWLHSTTHLDPRSPAHAAHLLIVARYLVTVVMDANCCLASQHLKGEHNVVADLISFAKTEGNNTPSPTTIHPDDVLTQRVHTAFASQVPGHFVIC